MSVLITKRLPFCVLLCFVTLWASLVCTVMATAPPTVKDVLFTVPFENVSGRTEYNWIGDSFVVLYADLLAAANLQVLDSTERNTVYRQLGLRPQDILTRAAVIRVAEAAHATLALIGNYDMGSDPQAATIAISARLIDVRTGRLVGNKVFNLSGQLSELQGLQGQLAWHMLYERDRATQVSREQLINQAKQVPVRAFESFVKGMQTTDAKMRETLLTRALQEHGGHYAQVRFALGSHYYQQGDFANAYTQFKTLAADDPQYVEALFYQGVSAARQDQKDDAMTTLAQVASVAALPELYTNAGIAALQQGNAAMGIKWLERALVLPKGERMARFNLGYGYWRLQKYAEASQQLKLVVAQDANDYEAVFLLAKSLELAEQAAEAQKYDDIARRQLSQYARWSVALDKIPSLYRWQTTIDRGALQRQLVSGNASQPNSSATRSNAVSFNLERARQFISQQNDQAALAELERIPTGDASSAEAYHLRGIIQQRRGEQEAALQSYQASIQANPRYVASHLALGRVYWARKDRAQSLTHLRRVLELEPQNREALTLKQKIETGN